MKVYFALIFTLLLHGCSTDETLEAFADLEQPKAVTISCLDAPDNYIQRIEYTYENGKAATERHFANGVLNLTTTYEYDSDTLLINEVITSDFITVTKTLYYNGDKQVVGIRWNTIQYDSNGNVVSEKKVTTPLEYENGLLVKEWQNWGGFITYEYKDGRISVKTEHTSYGGRHHITYYKYSSDLLSEERKETVGGTVMYVRKYKYDSRKRLESITEDGEVVEENTYDGQKIMEKIIRYFGIDPGFSPCNGNFKYKYEY